MFPSLSMNTDVVLWRCFIINGSIARSATHWYL